MDRWEIRPAPNAQDPGRHLLLLRGGAADVAAVLKKFGALCGRPTPLDGDDYNLCFVLHSVTSDIRAKLDDWLGQMSPEPVKPVVEPPKTPVPVPVPAPAPAPTPTPAPVVVALVPPPPPPPPPVPVAKQPLISIGPESVPAALPPIVLPPAPAVVTPKPVPAPTEPKLAAPLTPPATQPLTSPGGAASLTNELRADWTFENFQVGAYNRFAHAAAMSVVTAPGSMYNPLFLYGVPGTGKSHLLYAIAAAMSKGLGTASLLVTSGARLSRAVSAAEASGSMAAIDKKVANSKAIFVDDIHLLSVNEKNKELLAKIFKSFFDRSQQVVITSMYPPKALATLEEELRFTFSRGWAVDLKVPSPNVQRDIVSATVDRLGADMNGDDVIQLAEKLTIWGYSDMALWVRRLVVLRRLREAARQPVPLLDMMRIIYDPISVASEVQPISTTGVAFTPPPATAASEPLAIIVPKGQDGLVAYAAKQFFDAGAKFGFTRSYNIAMWETYDASQQVGVPFQIADLCNRAGVSRVLLVGPGPDSPMAPRANEFGHAVRRILDSAGVATGWIPHAQLQMPAHYVNAHLDFEP